MGGSGLTLPGAVRHPETKALVMEILITMLLVLVFLGATDPERGDALKDLAGIAVGLALAVGHWVGVSVRASAPEVPLPSSQTHLTSPFDPLQEAVPFPFLNHVSCKLVPQIPFSGGSMNPFRTLGSALTESHWDYIWVRKVHKANSVCAERSDVLSHVVTCLPADRFTSWVRQ